MSADIGASANSRPHASSYISVTSKAAEGVNIGPALCLTVELNTRQLLSRLLSSKKMAKLSRSTVLGYTGDITPGPREYTADICLGSS